MAEPEVVSIAMPPYIFPDVRAGFERAFPGLVLFRMPPEAEPPGEHVYGIGVRNLEPDDFGSGCVAHGGAMDISAPIASR